MSNTLDLRYTKYEYAYIYIQKCRYIYANFLDSVAEVQYTTPYNTRHLTIHDTLLGQSDKAHPLLCEQTSAAEGCVGECCTMLHIVVQCCTVLHSATECATADGFILRRAFEVTHLDLFFNIPLVAEKSPIDVAQTRHEDMQK